MHHNLAALGRVAENDGFAALCNLLSFYSPGDEIDVSSCAIVLGLEPTLVAFYLDTLQEVGAITFIPPTTPLSLAA